MTVEPGQTCSTCERRVPYPRKESSPQSRPFSYRVPLEEAEAHREILDTTARYIGVHEQPHHVFKLVSLACALVPQDESLRGFAERGRSLANAEVPGTEKG